MFVGCSEPEQRADIPILMAQRWEADGPFNDSTLRDLDALNQQGFRNLSIELLLAPDAEGLPVILLPDSQTWNLLYKAILQRNFRLTLALNYSTRYPLFGEKPVAPDDWLDALLKQWEQKLLPRIAGLPIERIVVGTDFRTMEPYALPWQKFLRKLRRLTDGKFPSEVKFTYAAAEERLERIDFWDSCDEIAWNYQATLNRPPSDFRKLHRQLDSLSNVHSKPLFAAQANLIGPNKSEQLNQRLNFWPDSTRNTGLTCNTLFPLSIWTDDSPYFGAAKDSSFRRQLQSLLKAAKEDEN